MPILSRKREPETPVLRTRIHDWLGRRSPQAIQLLAMLGVGLMAELDYLTGYEISFSVFYLAPVALAVWYGDRRSGLVIALLSAAAWLGVDQASGHPYSTRLIELWDAGVRLAFFLITAHLLARLKEQLQLQSRLARSDMLTGMFNGRAFRDELQRSIQLARRSSSPLTLAYIDVDNFKTVNDTQGHDQGDRLLRVIGDIFLQSMRVTDYGARVGGDEFAIVLPATGAEGGDAIIAKLRRQLDARVAEGGWPVSFSIGVVTLQKVSVTVEEAIKLADSLMYEVKRAGKNAMRHRVL